jgi:hypothetical protein
MPYLAFDKGEKIVERGAYGRQFAIVLQVERCSRNVRMSGYSIDAV